jgi:hypothetical protein
VCGGDVLQNSTFPYPYFILNFILIIFRAFTSVSAMNRSFLTLAIPEVKWLDLDPGRTAAIHGEARWTRFAK